MKAYSAPGKALLAGGYLVLDPQYPSYVTALSSRMHAVISEEESNTGDNNSTISIFSPQFEGEWEYTFPDKVYTKDLKEKKNRRNPFVEATISTVLAYIQPQDSFNIVIRIFSDPGYHSKSGAIPKVSSNNQKEFLFHGKPIDQVAKTGLGSSAGLVSVISTALLSHFKKGQDIQSLKNIIHNTAQIAHCYAQKKIGSGFDVAAAIFGSIIYRRFDPKDIDSLFADESYLTGESDHVKLRTLIDSEWDFTAKPVALPPKIRLLMGDIEGGSETPKLVSKVHAWKKENVVESTKLYTDLNNANKSLIDSLQKAQLAYTSDPNSYDTYLTGLTDDKVTKDGPFQPMIQSIGDIRVNLRKLTKFSGADVEPESQTKLLDNCDQLPGVLGGVVPGAGGFDAICLLVTEDSVAKVIQNTTGEFSSVSWLDLREESEGIVAENPNDYDGL
ncbi:phosphomevalonate kinase [[Candida] anglica]|uniref:Phosphomevalonate kinase n=1 Tax=[Candida] anglica TaxID=148631 RepID=A0ABP0E6F0_9ASCO